MTASSTYPVNIDDLRGAVTGRVIAPGDDGYDRARTIFYGGFDRRPAVVVQVADERDVARVVGLAQDTGLELAVRGGGHSLAGHSVSESGIVLDLSALRSLEIDVERRVAWAGAGLTAGEYTTAAGRHGLATGFGDTGSVGVGGITLSGGIGFLVRKHGLTIDSLLAAEVVTADGRLRRADAEQHPDLFWALRGGGGNFGVVTRFEFRLHEVGTVVGGILLLPATPEVVRAFVAAAEAAPEELSTIANVMTAPPLPFVPAEVHGRLVLVAFLTYAGDVEAGERALAPFRALAEPIVDMMRPIPYPDMFMPEEEYHPTAAGRNLFLDRVDDGTVATIFEHLEASTAPMRVAQVRVLGGAMARVPAEATAFAHRARRVMVNLGAIYEDPGEAGQHERWVEAFAAALREGSGATPGAYAGFVGDEGPERVREAYPGPTWERLREVKARYDPSNLFRLNQNVPPADAR